MEHRGRGFRAGQTALRCRRCTNVLVGQHTVLVAFPALLSFASAGHGTHGECAIYLGFRVVGTMVWSRESVQTPFTIELWVIVDPASIFSSLYSRPVAFLVGLSSLVCGLGTGISHGYAHFVLSLERLCGTRVATHCNDCNDWPKLTFHPIHLKRKGCN